MNSNIGALSPRVLRQFDDKAAGTMDLSVQVEEKKTLDRMCSETLQSWAPWRLHSHTALRGFQRRSRQTRFLRIQRKWRSRLEKMPRLRVNYKFFHVAEGRKNTVPLGSRTRWRLFTSGNNRQKALDNKGAVRRAKQYNESSTRPNNRCACPKVAGKERG